MLLSTNALRSLGALVLLTLAIFWLCDFAITESDFSWHVAAGRLMRETWHFIHVDPFAWTRGGLPYGSNHEWLAQIILSLAADYGAHAVVFLRSVLVAATFSILLLIGGRLAWIGLPLAFLVLTPSIGAFVDRPQLFTFVLFAGSLLAAARFLSASRPCQPSEALAKEGTGALAIFPLLQILWVNVHGGAAVLNVIVVFALFIQSLWERKNVLWVGLTLLSLLPASLVSPMGFQNITYLLRLQGDVTVNVIKEWMPRSLPTYLAAWWPVYLFLIGALAFGRRNLPFSIVVLLPLIYLSRSAYRHEVLFGLAALVIAMMQLPLPSISSRLPFRHVLHSFSDGGSQEPKEGRERVWERGYVSMMAAVALLTVPILYQSRNASWGFVQRERAYGAVLRDRVAGAVAFLDRNGLRDEKTFNTYNVGGELIGHGRKVFADGRNIDYGDAFLTALFAAATSAESWKTLEDQYGFTVAIVDFQEPDGDSPVPYVDHLSRNSAWSLAYLDDFVAVYVAEKLMNQLTNEQASYTYIDPRGLKKIANPTPATLSAIEAELKRMMEANPDGIRATMMLSRMLSARGALVEAENLLRRTVDQHPNDYRPHEALGLFLIKTGRYEEASKKFDVMLSLLGNIANNDVREGIALAFEQYGATSFAERYR